MLARLHSIIVWENIPQSTKIQRAENPEKSSKGELEKGGRKNKKQTNFKIKLTSDKINVILSTTTYDCLHLLKNSK